MIGSRAGCQPFRHVTQSLPIGVVNTPIRRPFCASRSSQLGYEKMRTGIHAWASYRRRSFEDILRCVLCAVHAPSPGSPRTFSLWWMADRNIPHSIKGVRHLRVRMCGWVAGLITSPYALAIWRDWTWHFSVAKPQNWEIGAPLIHRHGTHVRSPHIHV